MRSDIISYLQKEIYSRATNPENKFGIGVYYHIEAVVKNGILLAEKFNADIEVVTIAAWLHDVASITDYSLYEMHHIYGAEIAEDILTKFNYDRAKLDLVKKCIRNHRGSVKSDRISIEEICVADADAISHVDNIPSLLYLAYVTKGMGISDGSEFVKSKLERSYSKLSDRSKVFFKEKFNNALKIF